MMAVEAVFTPRLEQEASAIIRRSEKWVDALDRIRLGVFAVSRGRLVSSAALHAASNDDALEHYLRERYEIDMDVEAGAEFRFWENLRLDIFDPGTAWRRPEYRADLVNPEEDGEYMQRFIRLYQNPTCLPYFEAGIWDLEFIGQCIASGVDPQLALSMAAQSLSS